MTAPADPASTTPEQSAWFADSVRRLAITYGEAMPPGTVDAVLLQSYKALAESASVTSFLPILTEKAARARLAASSGS